MSLSRRSLFAAAAAATLFAGQAWAQASVKVENAWARPTVAGQAGGGGFLKISGAPAGDKLVSATAAISKTVELHRMEMDGNVMRMRQIDFIEVPAGGVVELKPGGLHVMFIGLTKTLKAGETFPMTLKFEKAGEVKVDVKVQAQPEAGAAQHKH